MKKPKFSQTITVDIESLSHEGRGIALHQGKTTFISGALPNERVTCKLIKKRERYDEGNAIDIIHSAPERTAPLCEHYGICGGCSMQHIEASAQIHFKQRIVLEQLNHFGKVTPENILPPITGNPWGYRRKARLGVRYDAKQDCIIIGFREKSSNSLTPIKNCLILHPAIGTKITALNALIRSLTQYKHISQIEIAIGDYDTALVFRHLTPLPPEDVEKLCEFANTHAMHIYLQPNAPEKIHKIWPRLSPEKLHYDLPHYQLEMYFHPLDFIQVNGGINQLLIQRAIELLNPKPDETILDLFCGLGNFTLPLARHAARVIGIEGSHEMVMRAQENAHDNQITNTEFYMANLSEPPLKAAWMQRNYAAILLDPPRTGAKELISHFKNFSAKRIVYVSCNPATLARDAGELVYNYKYKLKQVGIVDMFPHTSHIETIALFEK